MTHTRARNWIAVTLTCCVATVTLACANQHSKPTMPSHVTISRHVTQIYHGVDYAGSAFSVRIEQPRERLVRREGSYVHEIKSERECPDLLVVVEERNRANLGTTCITEGIPDDPSVACNGKLVSIEGFTRPEIGEIELELKGAQTVIKPITVSKRFGGPLGFYYQKVPISSVPRALIELLRNGEVVRSISLPHITSCSGV